MTGPASDQSERDEERCCITSDAEGRILTASFPPLVHSVSVRPIPGALYRFTGFDSDNTNSALAQVGRAPSLVPSSQKAENTRWQSWLAQPSTVIGSDVAVEGSRVSLEHRVSPGVSEICQSERDHIQLPSAVAVEAGTAVDLGEHVSNGPQDVNKLPSSSNSSQLLGRYEELVSRLRRLEQYDAPESSLSLAENEVETRTADSMAGRNPKVDTDDEELVSSAEMHEQNGISTTREAQGLELDNVSDIEKPLTGDTSEEPSSMPPPLAAQPEPPASEGTDADEAWKTFVFGNEDSDEIGKVVFEEARHDAARRIQPSDPITEPEEHVDSESNSNIATVGTVYLNDLAEPSDLTESPPPTENSAKATYDHSSIGPTLESIVSDSDAPAGAPSVEANAGTSLASGTEVSTDSLDRNDSISVEHAESSTAGSHSGPPPSMATSMAVVPAQSDVGVSDSGASAEQFRFVPPKLFVGSRSNMPHSRRHTDARVGISLTRRRGRPRRRANDGRTDIRALPNYSSDPIEEVEEQKRVPKSIFPALELA